MTAYSVEALALNESFCRALLRAGLTEEDVATRLGVDPKTVRRWMEGRALPYRRHRWALATMLGVDEADLWPQLRSAGSRPTEMKAVYPHLEAVPHGVWLRLFDSAECEIGILDDGALFSRAGPGMVSVLADRAESGVHVRICITALDEPDVAKSAERLGGRGVSLDYAQATVVQLAPLRRFAMVEMRQSQGAGYGFIYYADSQLLTRQYILGVPGEQAPVLHLAKVGNDDMFSAYRGSFERVWLTARQLG